MGGKREREGRKAVESVGRREGVSEGITKGGRVW